MKETDRQRIERCLEEIDTWRASGLKLGVYVQQSGADIGHWRAWLSWEKRWRKMLANVHGETPHKPGVEFVRAVPTAQLVQQPLRDQDCLCIVLSARTGTLQASIQWPLNRLGASSAWLREVLA
jgi:hypothetical protein